MINRLTIPLILVFFSAVYFFLPFEVPISVPSIGAVIPCKDDTTKGIEQKIRECPIPANERAAFKGKEIEKIKSVVKVRKQFSGGDYYIEITDMRAIPDGVEIFARAWGVIGGEQIGFGIDGTVDIERFVFVNPPVLIDDPNGTIIRQWTDKITGELQTRTLREDPKEAILQALVSTIEVKQQKFRSGNIVAGKVGNTTLTAYPNAGTGTAPTDGQTQKIYGLGSGVVFSTLRADAGDSVDNTSTVMDTLLGSDNVTDNYRLLYRFGSGYNTSSVGSDTIDSATISFYTRAAGTGIGLGDTSAQIVDFNPADGSLFASGDHVNYGTTLFSDTSILASTADASETYHNFPLNASGIANINTAGNSYFGRRLKWDVDNSFTGTWASDNSTNWQSFGADDTGTTRDPKLVVEHTAAVVTAVGEEYIINFE